MKTKMRFWFSPKEEGSDRGKGSIAERGGGENDMWHTQAGLGSGMALLESNLALQNTRPLESTCFILRISVLGLFWEVKRKKKTDKGFCCCCF